ncbi:MAG: hypothetical protein RLY23_1531 [Actinomycetota bacterium]
MDGLVVVDKPSGWTSHDVVARMRRIFGQKRVGHAGTLDPDATGILLVGLGRATRLLKYVQETGKVYEGVVAFGIATDTLDAAGVELQREPMSFARADLESAKSRFIGDIEQIPPMVSAIKIGGKRLHELAREGIEVERPPRPVHISSIEISDFKDGPFPTAAITVACGSGTYIRTLAADLGTALGGYAHLQSLRRTFVGTFGLAEAHSLEAVEADPAACTLSPAAMVRDLASISLDPLQSAVVRHGGVFALDALPIGDIEGPFALLDGDELIAVYERRGSGLKASVVVALPVESA